MQSFQQTDAQKTTKLSELASELAVSKERNRQLKDMLDEKVRSQEEIHAQEENSQRLRDELEKEIAELKNQLMAQSIELQYKVEALN